MVINCQIKLLQPSDGKFRPGGTVAGAVKYSVNEEIHFTKISIKLKGGSTLSVKKKLNDRSNRFGLKENFADDEIVVMDVDNGALIPEKLYEKDFRFELRQFIPSSLDYFENSWKYYAKCEIQYYVSIEFETPSTSWFKKTDTKAFRKDIRVVGRHIMPIYPEVPCTYNKEKELKVFVFFLSSGRINLKAEIQNSVITPGRNISVNFELMNNTSLTIKDVLVQLYEKYKFILVGEGESEYEISKPMENVKVQMGSVAGGETRKENFEMKVPDFAGDLCGSNLVARIYYVLITVVLPWRYRNMKLKIPIQIGFKNRESIGDEQQTLWDNMLPVANSWFR